MRELHRHTSIRQLFRQYYELCKSQPVVPILLFNEADAILGKRKEGAEAGDWMVVDNWRLKYLGNDGAPQDVIDGINDVITTPTQTAKTVYNLSGQKLSKAQKGVNIINGKKYVVK